MSEEKAEAAEDTEAETQGSKSAIIIPAINSLILLIALGFLAYTKLVYKHAVITDAAEKVRILAIKEPVAGSAEDIGNVPFGPLTINILSSSDNTLPTNESSPLVRGKMHYLQTAFTLEIRNKAEIEIVKSLKPFILDKLIQVVGKKNFHELATVQGRYILHSQLIDTANQILDIRAHNGNKTQLVTNLYFTTFLVQ